MQPDLLNGSNPLDQLLPIISPEHSVSWWPLAPGWWILLGLLLIVPVIIWRIKPKILNRHLEKRRWQSTRNLLEQLYLECHSQTEITLALQHYLQGSNIIIKRAVHYFSKDTNFSVLIGEDWVRFLKKIYHPKTGGYAHLYGQQLYAKSCQSIIRLEELHHWAHCWINAYQKNIKKIHRIKNDD